MTASLGEVKAPQPPLFIERPREWVHSCAWCADPRTSDLRARIAATETVVALVRSHNCCDGADAVRTDAMIQALGVLDEQKENPELMESTLEAVP